MDTKGRLTPPFETAEHRVISLLFNVVNESPFETVNL